MSVVHITIYERTLKTAKWLYSRHIGKIREEKACPSKLNQHFNETHMTADGDMILFKSMCFLT